METNDLTHLKATTTISIFNTTSFNRCNTTAIHVNEHYTYTEWLTESWRKTIRNRFRTS